MAKASPGKDRHMAELAQALVFNCFRGPLERLHEGTFPSTQAGDYSDVKVVSPYGEIPWNQVSRISDEEMRELMVEVVDLTFTAISNVDNPQFTKGLLNYACETKLKWKRPEFQKAFVDAVKRFASRQAAEKVIAR